MFDALFLTTISLCIIASIFCWVTGVKRFARGKSILPVTARRPVPWGFVDLMLVILILFGATLAAQSILVQMVGNVPVDSLTARQHAWRHLLESGATVATIVLSVIVLVIRHRATSIDFGIVWRNMWQDIRVGAVAFFILAPPVIGLQVLLVQWMESKHPTIEMLKEGPDPQFALAAIVSAVIVAPVFEEFLIRLVLQGWLQKLADFPTATWQLWFGRDRDALTKVDGVDRKLSSDLGSLDPGKELPPRAVWPVLASACLFSALHIPHGVDCVPLFVLALGLGFLMRQTNRILPCIVVHFLLNAFSMGMVLLEVLK